MLTGVECKGRGRLVGRLVLLALVAAAFGVTAGSASAATLGSERAASAASAPTAAQDCSGPCPSIVFGLGSGGGTVEAWTEWKVGGSTKESCPLSPRGQCTFYIEEGFESSGAFLKAIPNHGVTFLGWEGNCRQSGLDCRFSPGDIITACAKFRVGNESIVATCPPPSVQLFKKGDGTGTVTTSGSTSNTVTCGPSCPSSIQTSWVAGDSLTLSAAAAAGSQFVRWDGCPAVQPDGTCRFPLTTSTVICSVFVKTGSGAPADGTCPYTTPPIVKNPKPPAAKPPRLGSRCTIPGSRYGDRINGTGRNDVICGRGGNDRLNGRGAHDLVLGGSGNDRLFGAAGNDRLRGDAGADVLNGGAGTDILEGGAGNDVIYSRGDRQRDTVSCGRGRDVVYADRLDRVARDCERVRRR